MKHKNTKITLFVAALTLLGGCTFTKIARSYADWIILGRLDDAFDLNKTQETAIEARMPGFLEFVDTKLVPDLVAMLQGTLERTQEGLKPEDADWIEANYKRLRYDLIDFIADDAGEFLMSLDDQQLKHFRKYLTERNEDLIEQLQEGPDEIAEDGQKRQLKFLEKWLGDFSREQTQALAKLRPIDAANVRERLERRQAFHNRVFETIAAKPGAKELAAALRAWGKDPASLLSKDIAQSYVENHAAYRRYAVQVDQLVTEKQRNHFRRELGDLIKSLQSIARPPKAQPEEDKQKYLPGH